MLLRRVALIMALGTLLSACGIMLEATTRPTADVRQAGGHIEVQLAEPTSPPASATAAPSDPDPSPGDPQLEPLDQYRLWMEQARELYPYPEPVERMWALMLCESSGDPEVIAGSYAGLFQYHPDTWAGDWNPYREESILDPRAQIFATAKAWQDGNQGWWGCY